ncbi:MAG: hypothetical protein K5695_03925 [Oscillospiraceae bacterium]|nr:hypothetical protein [Oscillospiraceae bacterium]
MDEFAAALAAAERDAGGKGIGTLGEKTLHLALKYYFAPDPGTHEQPLGGFIADAVTEEGVIEVQTRGLSRLKPKLDAFLPLSPVTVVHPVAEVKWLMRVDENGELLSKRKSPKHMSVYSAMRELYTLRGYLNDPNFRIAVCGVELAEYSVAGKRGRKYKLDRVPLTLRQLWMLQSPEDYAALLPEGLPEEFTVPELCELLHQPEMQVQFFLLMLRRLGCIAECGKRARLKLWHRLLPVCGASGGS